jgi:hypothetical protein
MYQRTGIVLIDITISLGEDSLMKPMEPQKSYQFLHKAVEKFSKGHFAESWQLLGNLTSRSLSKSDLKKLHRLFNLLMLGEFFGYHNLLQILDRFDLKSHHLYKIWHEFSDQMIMNLCNEIFWNVFRDRVLDLAEKSDSTWSRQEVTLVIDTSIFKQILADGDNVEEFDRFFSGQFNCPVCGFRLMLIGIMIGGIFYPIHFYVFSKKYTEKQVALTLLMRVNQKLDTLKKENGVEFPNLILSADNDFCDPDFSAACQDYGMDPLLVPTKSWKFEIDGRTVKLSDFIAELTAREENGESVFPYRQRARRDKFGHVVLLFFRLVNGKKINVIMTPDLSMKAKTMRRHWFQRTGIEQFFRFSKHTLAIQETRSKDSNAFVRNIAVNFLKVLVGQLFTRFFRQYKPLKKRSFHQVRRALINGVAKPDFLRQILMEYDLLLQTELSVI